LVAVGVCAVGTFTTSRLDASTITVTGPDSIGPLSVESSGTTSQTWNIANAGSLPWSSAPTAQITYKMGDRRAKLDAFNTPYVLSLAAGENKDFAATWATSGPEWGATEITCVWNVIWRFNEANSGPGNNPDSTFYSVDVTVVGYVPEPPSMTLFGIAISTMIGYSFWRQRHLGGKILSVRLSTGKTD
jgi:hypothetical protein